VSVYNYTTLGAVRQEVANRLFDPAQVFWSAPELNIYLTEALRTFNALTGFWRGDFTFNLVQAQVWYDLTTFPNTLRPVTVPLSYVVTLLDYMLLEPASTVTGGTFDPWIGSLQFTLDDLIQAIARRRDELLSLTGCTQTQSLVPAVAGRIQLADSIIDVRRMAYIPSTLFPTQHASPMWQEDTWGEESYNSTYLQAPAGMPFAYLLSTQPPISFDTDIPPAFAGNYDILTTSAGPALTTSTPALTLSIPDDWVHILVWGALADLLSRESLAKDTPRAEYCEKRYRMGVAALAAAPALLAMRLDNTPLLIDSVRAADQYNNNWQAEAQGSPRACYYAGMNLIAFRPPSAGPFSMTATVVQNAPFPVVDTDPFPCSRDDLDAIIDYTQHLAAFKQGGQEFSRTGNLLTRFMTQCGVYNAKLAEMGEYTSMLGGLASRERDMNPVMSPDGEDARGGGGGG